VPPIRVFKITTIMTDDIRRIGSLGPPKLPDGLQQPQGGQETGKPSFSNVLNEIVSDVDRLQKTAESTTDKLLTGDLQDVHQVVVAMEEAQTSFKLLMEVRNKMVEAYKEVLKMQV
jgi:flagellar hook-basal body complex protein FliE